MEHMFHLIGMATRHWLSGFPYGPAFDGAIKYNLVPADIAPDPGRACYPTAAFPHGIFAQSE